MVPLQHLPGVNVARKHKASVGQGFAAVVVVDGTVSVTTVTQRAGAGPGAGCPAALALPTGSVWLRQLSCAEIAAS
jgi:hypothetical protein